MRVRWESILFQCPQDSLISIACWLILDHIMATSNIRCTSETQITFSVQMQIIINFDHSANQYKRYISLWSQWNPLSLGKDNTWIKSMQFWDCSPLYIFSTLLTPFFIIFNSKVSVSKRLSNLDSGYFTHMMQWSRTLSIIVYLASILLSFSYKDKCEWATLASY